MQNEPRSALAVARRVLAGTDDQTVRALARVAAARALFEAGSVTAALAEARRAVEDGSSAPIDVAAPVTTTATAIMAASGCVDEALASLMALCGRVEGVGLARVRMQIAYVLFDAGRLHESLAEFARCDELLAADGDARDRSRLHLNRGLVLLQQGRLDAAAADFDLAEQLAAEAGMRVGEALAVANRAVLLGRARRLAESLVEFDRADRLFELSGSPDRLIAIAAIDRAEVMMHSGLLADAVAASRSAIDLIAPSGNAVMIADAWLMLARAELAAGMTRSARSSAAHAAEIFDRTDRTHMVSHARSLVVQAQLTGASSEPAASQAIADASRVADELRHAGWDLPADELSIARIRTARRWNRLPEVRGDVERIRAGVGDGRRDTMISGWWAEALARSLDGDRAGAVAACHDGLGVLDEIVAEAPSLGERSAAMRIGRDLSQFLIELAVDAGDAHTVFSAAEGTRARALHDELAESGRHRPLTTEGAHRLRGELAARLGDRTAVQWLTLDDRILAVVVDEGGSRVVDVASRHDVIRSADRVAMWLDIAAAEPDGSSARALAAVRRLDELLIEPLDLPAGRGIILVPTGALHRIPWSGLPAMVGRPVTLAPNAQLWLEADRRSSRPIRTVGLVAGPDVRGVDHERAAVSQWHGAVTLATGERATPASARSMFRDADLVHVAAHGRFRSDHPLLSTIRLGDGEATLYDAVPERVGARLVILSSCEGGAHGTADGSEVLGLSSVLLARGAAAVLAPLTVVRELECAEFVAEVHAALAGGEPFACAVAAVRARWLADDDLSRWAVASSFTCFGSDAVAVATD